MNFSVHLILRASYTPVAAGFAIFFAAISFDPCGNELTVRALLLDGDASSKPGGKYREYSTDLISLSTTCWPDCKKSRRFDPGPLNLRLTRQHPRRQASRGLKIR